jgi:hypothetical protein
MSFRVGDQIAYVPSHVDFDKNPKHPDIEYGFITSFNIDGVPFCRYWSNFDLTQLRTQANGECTPLGNLRRYNLKPQAEIDHLLVVFGYRKE